LIIKQSSDHIEELEYYVTESISAFTWPKDEKHNLPEATASSKGVVTDIAERGVALVDHG